MSFKMGDPVAVPPSTPPGKWGEVIAKAQGLANGKAIPLEFENQGQATAFANGRSSYFRTKGLRIQRRGSVAYVSKLDSA